MPAPERVARFVDALSRPTLLTLRPSEFDDEPNFNTWWKTFEEDESRSERWAQELTERETMLLEHACRLLSGEPWAQLIATLKKEGVYPPEWGSYSGQFRATGDRYFDRLRLTFLSPGIFTPTPVRRTPYWTAHDGSHMDPQTTVFARRHPENAMHALHRKLAKGSGALGALVGLADEPEDFAFPLAWSEAVHSGLGEDVVAALPEDVRDRLEGFADDVEDGIEGLGSATFWARLGGVGLLAAGAAPLGGMALLAGAATDRLGDAIAHWPAALRRAADEDATLDDVAYELLHMLRVTDYDGVFERAIEGALELDEKVLFVGLSHQEVLDLERALRPGSSSPEPMIVLGDAFAENAKLFGNTPFALGTTQFKDVVSTQRHAHGLWTRWWNSARPTVDAAYVLETAGIVLQQLMHLDDAVLALEGLANGEGIVAASLRSSVADQGQAAFSDALGGTSLSGAARYLLRQTLSDLFIDWVAADEEAQDVPEAERADPAGIRAALPWMRGSGKRTAIDAALGRVVEVDADSAGELYPGFTFLRALLDLGPQTALRTRAWLLPGLPDADRGAFGRLLSALSASATSDLPAPDISLADLGYIREWIIDARQSSAVELKSQLEPSWTMRSDPVDVPDDLDVDPIEPIDPGPQGPLG